MYLKRVSRYNQSSQKPMTMTVTETKNVPSKTIYGPDDKPMFHLYEVQPIEFGFQVPNGNDPVG